MNFYKKLPPGYTIDRRNSNRRRKSGIRTVIRRLIQWRRRLMNPIKSTEDCSQRRVDRVIWIAGLIVFAIALIEALFLDRQKNAATVLTSNKPVPITQPQNTQAVDRSSIRYIIP
jgi:hypothetical protein